MVKSQIAPGWAYCFCQCGRGRRSHGLYIIFFRLDIAFILPALLNPPMVHLLVKFGQSLSLQVRCEFFLLKQTVTTASPSASLKHQGSQQRVQHKPILTGTFPSPPGTNVRIRDGDHVCVHSPAAASGGGEQKREHDQLASQTSVQLHTVLTSSRPALVTADQYPHV